MPDHHSILDRRRGEWVARPRPVSNRLVSMSVTIEASDPRGFAVKFRTAEGNWDFVGE